MLFWMKPFNRKICKSKTLRDQGCSMIQFSDGQWSFETVTKFGSNVARQRDTAAEAGLG
jgi:hypothetical protein